MGRFTALQARRTHVRMLSLVTGIETRTPAALSYWGRRVVCRDCIRV
jgi:hypothetical protein